MADSVPIRHIGETFYDKGCCGTIVIGSNWHEIFLIRSMVATATERPCDEWDEEHMEFEACELALSIKRLCLSDIWAAHDLLDKHISILQQSPDEYFFALRMINNRSPDENRVRILIDDFDKSVVAKNVEQKKFIVWSAIREGYTSKYFNQLDHHERQLFLEGSRYLFEFPREIAKQEAEAALSSLSPSFVENTELQRIIMQAVSDLRPFAFIRIGDGEGRCISDLQQYPEIHRASHSIASGIWFWTSNGAPSEIFFKLLRDAYSDADVIGINPPMRIDLEYRNSLFGYVGVVGGNNFAFKRCADQSETHLLARNWAFGELKLGSFFSELCQSTPEIIVICPHQFIGDRLKGLFNANIAHVMRVPAENHPLMRDLSLRVSHFPEMFEQINAEIWARPPCLYLVGAGAFGKIYCASVRRRGGVALDVGALVDEWMGVPTR